MENQPLNYTDPSGHCKAHLHDCLVDGGPGFADGSLIPIGDAVPQVLNVIPDRVDNPALRLGCTSSLLTCHVNHQIKDFEEGELISEGEFILLLDAVANEMHEGWTPGKWGTNVTGTDLEFMLTYTFDFLAGRADYDTPFYDGGGLAEGTQVCIENLGCHDRSEVNYFAQGMWAAAAEDSLEEAIELSEWWNQNQYGHPPTEGEIYWTEFGYNWYKDWLLEQEDG